MLAVPRGRRDARAHRRLVRRLRRPGRRRAQVVLPHRRHRRRARRGVRRGERARSQSHFENVPRDTRARVDRERERGRVDRIIVHAGGCRRRVLAGDDVHGALRAGGLGRVSGDARVARVRVRRARVRGRRGRGAQVRDAHGVRRGRPPDRPRARARAGERQVRRQRVARA